MDGLADNADFLAALRRFYLRALSGKAEDRFPDGASLAMALREALATTTPHFPVSPQAPTLQVSLPRIQDTPPASPVAQAITAAPAPPEPAENGQAAVGSEDPWIDTPLCTSCRPR